MMESMATAEIQPERIQSLNDHEERDGDYVLYWMQASQRAEDNHALEYAVQRANDRGLPLLVCWGITSHYPEASERHYRFLVEGIPGVAGALERRGISFAVRLGDLKDHVLDLGEKAALVICDRAYTRHQKKWRSIVAAKLDCEVVQVETDLVVPVEVTSNKREYAARTIRPRIHRNLDDFLVELRTTSLDNTKRIEVPHAVDPDDVEGIMRRLEIDRTTDPVTRFFEGGTSQGKAKLRALLKNGMSGYAEERSHPEKETTSHLSPYLHFGQVSPLWAALTVRESDAPKEDRDSFLEELIVRRELAINFVEYEPDYDSYSALPEWSRKTLEKHREDEREHVYTAKELENAETHDPYWNASMNEMRRTGYMHNYMRMYWGKKIVEWTNTPEYAYKVAIDLNNKYFLDGRDPNSWSNVGWIFGLHDRPWQEREIFGTVRYMSSGGLERKFDIDGYVDRVDALG